MSNLIADFFSTNRVILLAIYGQAFFTLGLSVALQWRSESRLELARSLPLLAAFGLGSSLAIWADIFIPVQATYVNPEIVQLLRIGQALLFIASFASLLYFGIRLNWSGPRVTWIPWILAGGLSLIVLLLWVRGLPVEQIRLWSERLGRLLFVLPGALLAAWGLRGQAMRISAMRLPEHIVQWLRVAGFTFGFYALAGGVLVPLSSDGETWLDHVTGVPAAVPRAVAGCALALAMIQALTIFRVELQRLVTSMGREQALAADRQRIGRELHDGTIQAIYGAGLMLDNVLHTIQRDPDLAVQELRAVMESLNTTIEDIRRYIHDLSEDEGELAETLGELTNEFRASSNLDVDYRIEGNPPKLPVEVRTNLLQMVREALTNARRHSGADHVDVLLRGDPDVLRLIVADNGRGLPPGGPFRPGGKGIPNLYARARLLDGRVRLLGRPGEGTIVEIEVPYQPSVNGAD
ncbi:MAG: sensor histidine kinase [Ardenticatenaceae bacterium]|nr:sensor histidine kinase [Ardenticatenaceae bacterium]HBY98584.1 hypothetical protein [Chloroflexota bacterium]